MSTAEKHVVHICGTASFGGVQRLLLGLAGEYRKLGWRQSAVCIVDREGVLSEEFAANFDEVVECRGPWPTFDAPRGLYRIGRAVRRSLSFTFGMRFGQALRKLQPSVVHSHISTRLTAQAAGALRYANAPFVWTIHGDYHVDASLAPDWRKAAVLLRAHRDQVRVTAVSRTVADNISSQIPELRDLVEVVHCGVDLSAFAQATREQARDVRRSWDIPDTSFVFGSTGRLVDAKAYEHFVAAAALLRSQGLDAYFLLAGEGSLRGMIEDAVRQHHLEDRFRLVGFQADVPRFLSALDAFVLSSRTEGIPLSLIEAMAMRLPCVATNVGGVNEVFDARMGMVVAPESPQALADAMCRVMSGAVGPDHLEHASRVARTFALEQCAERFVATYDALTKTRSGQGSSPRSQSAESQVVE